MAGTMFSLEVLGEIPGMEDTGGSSVEPVDTNGKYSTKCPHASK